MSQKTSQDFSDPENKDKIIKKISELSDKKKVQEYIEEIFPNWLLYSCEKYSPDYPHLQANWITVCKLTKTTPKKIILVNDIKFDTKHEVIKAFCEEMTQKGYVVRRAGEFIVCRHCNAAIPAKDVWHFMKDAKLPIPSMWSDTCSSCPRK